MLNNDQWLRVAMLAMAAIPCAAICWWAYTAAPEYPDPAPVAPEPDPALDPPLVLTGVTEEYEAAHEADFMTIPSEHEAVQQIREAMAGKVVKCAVCQVEFPDLYRVQFADGSAFCCHVCAALLRAGSPT